MNEILLPDMLSIIMKTYAMINPGIARLIISIVLIIIFDLTSVLLNKSAIGRESKNDRRTTEIPRITVCAIAET
jgi:hypothetical protein